MCLSLLLKYASLFCQIYQVTDGSTTQNKKGLNWQGYWKGGLEKGESESDHWQNKNFLQIILDYIRWAYLIRSPEPPPTLSGTPWPKSPASLTWVIIPQLLTVNSFTTTSNPLNTESDHISLLLKTRLSIPLWVKPLHDLDLGPHLPLSTSLIQMPLATRLFLTRTRQAFTSGLLLLLSVFLTLCWPR